MQKYEFETERLEIRLIKYEDKELFTNLYCDPKTMKKIASPFTEEQANKCFDKVMKMKGAGIPKQLMWVVILKDSDEKIGIQSLTFNVDVDINVAEVGIMLNRSSHGKSIPEEAVLGLLHLGFEKLNLNAIYAKCSSTNFSTLRVIRKLGFKKDTSEVSDRESYVIKSI
ncbi:GNAT family N-acetyltransferase [uncultured Shewanella sp.]|uniref:GNAT family N-acetyltransferase n=1 Tax=uncultured Shewanella sp. TaxID=173975 RepID=UPI0026133BC3|nr:GNAT family N-acetyltransferase [uncultured Shewanella sp.]